MCLCMCMTLCVCVRKPHVLTPDRRIRLELLYLKFTESQYADLGSYILTVGSTCNPIYRYRLGVISSFLKILCNNL